MTELSDKVDHFENEIGSLVKCVASNETQLKTQNDKIGTHQKNVNMLLDAETRNQNNNEAVHKRIHMIYLTSRTIKKLRYMNGETNKQSKSTKKFNKNPEIFH